MSAYKTEYLAVWPDDNGEIAVEATQDKEAFFAEYDELIRQLQAWKCPKHYRPVVQVRVLQWTNWVGYGIAQARGWIES